MSYRWMKFGYFGLHPLIVHASWLRWECALGSRNALWVPYLMEELVLAFEGILNVCTWNVDFLGWHLFRCSFETSCRARKWDSKMIWHMCMEHYMDELLTDEVCIFGTSSMDCACTTSLMKKWNMFLVCSLRGLRRGVTYFCVSWWIKRGQFKNIKCIE
jgi:hypothetical protein